MLNMLWVLSFRSGACDLTGFYYLRNSSVGWTYIVTRVYNTQKTVNVWRQWIHFQSQHTSFLEHRNWWNFNMSNQVKYCWFYFVRSNFLDMLITSSHKNIYFNKSFFIVCWPFSKSLPPPNLPLLQKKCNQFCKISMLSSREVVWFSVTVVWCIMIVNPLLVLI